MHRINFRQILIHFIGTWFFMFAFQTLFSLHEIKIINIFRNVGQSNAVYEFDRQGITTNDYVNFIFWTNVGKTVGLLIGFVVSLIIAFKRKWFWLNSVIILITAYALAWTEFLGLNFLHNIYFLKELEFISIELLLISLSILFAIIGIIIFLIDKSYQFIKAQNSSLPQTTTANSGLPKAW